ncbi:hypothetical protein [Hydrogenimonas sp. SS33]|uniref:hypothetical protein n=1 Tax=Hydrogenimonas leucolamina TaxID=2954236 RepID=UPI00336BC3CE
MYHYLKWATVGLFFRRNVRYLTLIAVGIIGIFLADAVYRDMADLAYKTGDTQKIGLYLAVKWVVVVLCSLTVLFSIMRLGFSRSKKGPKEKKRSKKGRSEAKTAKKEAVPADDPYMKRLEKFKGTRPLRKRADVVLEKKKKRRFGL